MTFTQRRQLDRIAASLLALSVALAPFQLVLGPLEIAPKTALADKCCFTGGTLVLLAEGRQQPIEELQPGARVVGRNGSLNRVLRLEVTRLGNRPLWAFNEGRPFVTAEHPFLGPEGWVTISPAATREENPELLVAPLLPGQRLLRGGFRHYLIGVGVVRLVREPVYIQSLVTVSSLRAEAGTPICRSTIWSSYAQ